MSSMSVALRGGLGCVWSPARDMGFNQQRMLKSQERLVAMASFLPVQSYYGMSWNWLTYCLCCSVGEKKHAKIQYTAATFCLDSPSISKLIWFSPDVSIFHSLRSGEHLRTWTWKNTHQELSKIPAYLPGLRIQAALEIRSWSTRRLAAWFLVGRMMSCLPSPRKITIDSWYMLVWTHHSQSSVWFMTLLYPHEINPSTKH